MLDIDKVVSLRLFRLVNCQTRKSAVKKQLEDPRKSFMIFNYIMIRLINNVIKKLEQKEQVTVIIETICVFEM